MGGRRASYPDPAINLSPTSVLNGDGSVKQAGLDNHAMGTIFEELVRRFNEENNEEAGEHWTPRDAVKLTRAHGAEGRAPEHRSREAQRAACRSAAGRRSRQPREAASAESEGP